MKTKIGRVVVGLAVLVPALAAPETGQQESVVEQDALAVGELRGWPAAISASRGGTYAMVVEMGAAHAGKPYAIWGTLAGTSPGVTPSGVLVPIHPDAYTLLTIERPGVWPLLGFAGLLDAQGRARSTLDLSYGVSPALVGTTVHHTALRFGAALEHASAPIALAITQ